MYMQVAQYWEKIMTLLNPKGKDLWDTVQNCFDEYNKILKGSHYLNNALLMSLS